ncbi:MAG: nickel pincer cofactor biosynthesis protein LarC [Chloroflexi bacterium]|nr:nickel pincer cofactor biosynthesis protein LarC [Chloroflexota bacterium]MYK61917.1 nickel pincer cofactor biosynthesis protein LarC [Chloroflexota bacterium]
MPDIAYLDIIGGVSGDMLISAILDAGLDKTELESELAKIVPGQFHLKATNTTRGSISATHVDVVLGDDADQRMGWQEFEDCIEASNLPDTDRAKIRSVFECLRAAEAQAHGTPEGKSHLHELGTLDTLIDIAGAVIGMRILGIDTLHASSLPASTGMSSSSHGKNASIAPATMAIIQNASIPLRISGHNQPVGEAITPTGAAIIATLAKFSPSNMSIETIGYGAGTRNTDTPPNVIGLWLGQSISESSLDETAEHIGVSVQSDVFLIETNIDDMTGEEIGYAMQVLFDTGALDVWTTPIQMKKSRPGTTLSVIAAQNNLGPIATVLFTHTSTLGVRTRQLERLVADRQSVQVETEYGPVRVKLRKIGNQVTQIAPEYDDCAKIATELGVPISQVMQSAKSAASNYLE